eukprot:3943114-Pyramimonas_sp.AAC.1
MTRGCLDRLVRAARARVWTVYIRGQLTPVGLGRAANLEHVIPDGCRSGALLADAACCVVEAWMSREQRDRLQAMV